MANYGGQRYTRPLTNDRPGPRFNTTNVRQSQRNNFNDQRNQINKSQQQQQQQTLNKSTNDATISTSSNSPSAQTQPTNSTDLSNELSIKSTENSSTENESTINSDNQTVNEQKRPRTETSTFDSTSSTTQQENNEKKTTQGGRCRLFIGNIPSDLTKEEFQVLFGKYGELIEYFVNPSRGFGFIKLSSRQLAEQAKHDLDGYVLRGKSLRIRFASQGATIKVKNLSPNVSNELLKEAFEQYFGGIERAVVIVDDRGKSIGEGIIEFEKKPSAQKCLNECTERCFFITSELRPVIVEPWDIKDEEDGLPEKSLVRNATYMKEREAKPRFAELNTIEHTIGLKWKELELQEKQLLEEVKRRMQYATDQVQIEIDQMYLEHQSQMLREELLRRQEDLRRIDELRSQEIDRRRNVYHQNQSSVNQFQYNDFQQVSYQNSNTIVQQNPSISAPIDAAYTTNQVARGYGLSNTRTNGDDFTQQQGFDRKHV